jgi:hypothetical protein
MSMSLSTDPQTEKPLKITGFSTLKLMEGARPT